jgi:hypothetical protein
LPDRLLEEEEVCYLREETRAALDAPPVDVAQAAELTGLSKAAIRHRIRRNALASTLRDGRHMIPVAELHRRGLLVRRDRYTSLCGRAESLEAQLRRAFETRDRLERELRELNTTVQTVWGIARLQKRELAELRAVRQRQWPIRWLRSTALASGMSLGAALRRG